MSRQGGGDDDHTGSATDIADHPALPDYEKLLGARPLRKSSQRSSVFLVKVQEHRLTSDLEKELQYVKGPARALNELSVVFGPIGSEQIKELLSSGTLRSQDLLLKSFDRWKTCKSFFPDISPKYSHDEDTDTKTDTSSASGLRFENTHSESGSDLYPYSEEIQLPKTQVSELVAKEAPMSESLEVEDIETSESSKPKHTSGETEASTAGQPFEPIHRNEVFTDRKTPRLNVRSSGEAKSSLLRQDSLEQERVRAPEKFETSRRLSNFSMVLVAIAVLGTLYVLLQKKNVSVSPEAPNLLRGDLPPDDSGAVKVHPFLRSKISEDNEAWAKSLRPDPSDDVYSLLDGDDGVVRKIRRVLKDYRLKKSQLSAADEDFLLRQSQPGSASPDGQVLALNVLAVHFMNQKNPSRAYQQLKQFVDEENTLDPATHVNLALTMYESGVNFDLAKPYLSTAIRQAGTSSRVPPFFPAALHSLYKLKGHLEIRPSDVDLDFQSYEAQAKSNPIFYGLWISALQKVKNPPKEHIQDLLLKAMWSDPDRVYDSGFDDIPVARNWFVREAFDGLMQAARQTETRLSKAQVDFLSLMVESRLDPYSYKKMIQGSLLKRLDSERASAPLSSLLFAYLKKEEGLIEDAFEALKTMFQDPVKNKYLAESSYAYAFAGELASYLGSFQEATVYFDSALRNPFESSALWGMALLARESSVSVGAKARIEAEAKMAEALSADRSFLPALLRRERLSLGHRASSR